MRVVKAKISAGARAASTAVALVVLLALCAPFAPRAQRAQEAGANLTGVSTRATERGTVVTVTGDAPLTRAQTWQDEEGFHVVGYKWSLRAGTPRGVRVRRVGDSLELVVPVKPGTSVTVHPRFNTLDIVVNGGLGAVNSEGETERAAEQRGQSAQGERTQRRPHEQTGAGETSPAARAAKTGAAEKKSATQSAPTRPVARDFSPEVGAQVSSLPPFDFLPPVERWPNAAESVPPPAEAAAAAPATTEPAQEAGAAAAELPEARPGESSWLKTVALVAALFAVLFVFLWVRSRWHLGDGEGGKVANAESEALVKTAGVKAVSKNGNGSAAGGRDDAAKSAPAAETQSLARSEGMSAFQSYFTPPPILFGAVRVEQEVEKLVHGEAHSVEVLASRATDDRRAVETCLLKAVNSRKLSGEERDRARRALEEYGFVARAAAALLSAPSAFERSSAARTLGAVKSASALPFLLEALYDAEPVVRTEAVSSLGSLGLPSAIGALIDMARRHPDIPAHLLGSALSACSVDCIELRPNGSGYSVAGGDAFTGEIAGLEPVAEIEELPEWLEDETLSEALERLRSVDVEARVAAAQQLSQFQVARAVEALAAMAANDRDAAVRAAAVNSLGLIGHESVFAPVLIAMADEAREVRATAARVLSSLNFDRADACVRVLETADEETLRRLTEACVAAGLARQALGRLASDDRRQAYEAFSLLSLVVRGGQTGMMLQVVESHEDLNVRLAAARLLALQGDPEVTARLRQIAIDSRTPEKLRVAIGEIISRGEQTPQRA